MRYDPTSNSMKYVEGNLPVRSPPQSQHEANDNEIPYALRDDPKTSSVHEGMRNEL